MIWIDQGLFVFVLARQSFDAVGRSRPSEEEG